MADSSVRVEVTGARELARTLKRAGVNVNDMKDANQRTGEIVVRAAGGVVPRRTGRLASSIRPSRMQAGVTIRAGGASLPYAGVQHYGWPRHHIVGRMFITAPAADTEPVWVENYFRELQKIIDTIEGA